MGVFKIETGKQHRFSEIPVNRESFRFFTLHGKCLVAYLKGGPVSVVKPDGTYSLKLSLDLFFLSALGVVVGSVWDHVVMLDDVGVVLLGVFVLS